MKRLLSVLLFGTLVALAADTALDRYVRAPDPAYRYQLSSTTRLPGLTMYVLDMVSQRWLTEAEVDRPEWRHWVMILKPDEVSTSTALLLINGGSNAGRPPSAPDPLLTAFAAATKTVVAQVSMVPNQPLTFVAAGGPRTEDAIIAWSWLKFLETGDERWPARLPMTKAAVRAMDAITEFCASNAAVAVNRYIVAGASKRGWTTWTTAAVDKRVVAIVPIVIDALNVQQSFIHHWRAYGFWAPSIRDYEQANLMRWLGSEEWARLMEIEDPYSYRERIMIPKMLVNSTGDQFFLPDSSQFYFNDLSGEKYLRYVPNTDHGIEDPGALSDMLAFYWALQTNTPRPRFSWRADRPAGSISVKALDEPAEVLLWQATNPDGRDFRLEKIGRVWKSTRLEAEEGGNYTVVIPAPDKGFTAAFIELTFPSGGPFPFRFTTEVIVTPDEYPFDSPISQ